MADQRKDGYDRLDEWGNRQAGRFADHPTRTTLGWALRIALAVVVIGVIVSLSGWALGWFNAGRDIVSPTNVKAQYAAVIEDYQALQAAAGNACSATNSGGPGSPTLVEDPAFAYKAQYRRITVDYNRRQNNIFEAKLVGPSGYPRLAPTLKEMEAKVC